MSTLDQQDIAALKQQIYRLEAQVDFLYKHLALTFVENTSAGDDPQVVDALRANNILEAIRLYRGKTGLSLAAAKTAVEEMRARLGI